jgi:hypothetical protein
MKENDADAELSIRETKTKRNEEELQMNEES